LKRLTVGCLLLLLVARGAAGGDGDIAELRKQAANFERQAAWDKAAEVYERILDRDRQLPEIRERYRICLRHAACVHRLEDPSFRELYLHRDLALAAKVYAEVLEKLHTSYVDSAKSSYDRLLAFGIDELSAALDDPTFRRNFLSDIPAQAITTEKKDLHSVDRRPRSLAAARNDALALAVSVQRAIGLKPAVTLLELACGACAGLDEYTLFLTPAQLSAEYAELDGGQLPPDVSAQMLDERLGVGYCQISGFTKGTPEDLDQQIEQLKLGGLRVLIMDLRGNGGGMFQPAVRTAERFLSTGIIVSLKGQLRDQNRTFKADNAHAYAMPLLVLIDGDTASSAEMVAGALKDNQRATLIGQSTYGKGSVQGVLPLETTAAGIRVSVAKFFSPLGKPYEGNGVTPHWAIPPAAFSLSDQALEMALAEARRLSLRMQGQ
jgi:hypothetical protein